MDKYPQKEPFEITLFYSENLKDFQFSETKESPALLSQGRAKFLGADKEISLPPQQREFVSDDTRARIKHFQTFSLILPNLIHKSKKMDLDR